MFGIGVILSCTHTALVLQAAQRERERILADRERARVDAQVEELRRAWVGGNVIDVEARIVADTPALPAPGEGAQ